jgi:hypothetical protein
MRRLMLAITMATFPLAAAQAQIPAHQLVSGQVAPMLAQANPGGAWCFVGRGLSMFQGSANGSQATISLPEVIYFDGTNYYQLGGQTLLNFASPTSGHIKFIYTFEYPLAITIPAFANYSETVGNPSNQVLVGFSISFTNGTDSSSCTLPVQIKYEML